MLVWEAAPMCFLQWRISKHRFTSKIFKLREVPVFPPTETILHITPWSDLQQAGLGNSELITQKTKNIS